MIIAIITNNYMLATTPPTPTTPTHPPTQPTKPSLLGSGRPWTMMKAISVTEYLNYEGGKFSKSRGTGGVQPVVL
jgi:hypothetical protein